MDEHGYKEYKSKFDFEEFKIKLENNDFTKEDVQKLFSFAHSMDERLFLIIDTYEMQSEDCIINKVYEKDDSQLVKEIKKLQWCNEWAYEEAKSFFDYIK